eukprot:CAMPEP_0117602590 /NCGR_PEP_ID=MMETSP0784-20121206/77663_1 /TAXON_ID=39447 /ORGANISM="" /LENGTH=589 /DNA_ID=CAMNT_0005405421 /DNA_START=15 /DNA_END=1784 /DNA_ORIENTATION=+
MEAALPPKCLVPEATAVDNNVVEDDSCGEKSAGLRRHWLFPLNMCGCLPAGSCLLFPRTWQVIQDWFHFIVIMGLFGSIALIAEALFDIMNFEERCSPFCIEESLAVLAVSTTFAYICKVVGTYDEQIQVKKLYVAQKKQDITDSYEAIIGSIEALLQRASESSATMAERSFEAKRRDFMRFLDRAEHRYGEMVFSSEAERLMMLKQFRRFIYGWLGVFQECSVEPVHKPKYVVSDVELEKCASIAQVATLTMERLKVAEVRFMSSQFDRHYNELGGLRSQHRRMTASTRKLAVTNQPPQEIELASFGSTPLFSAQAEHVAQGSAPSKSASQKKPATTRCCDCKCCCIKMKKDCVCRCIWSQAPGGLFYPKVCHCLFMQMSVLSDDHGITGFVFGVALAVTQTLPWKPYGPETTIDVVLLFLPTLAFMGCITTLLIMFEEIDVIQKMESEIRALQEESDRVSQRHKQMEAFWNSMQQLTDIWVNRTLPRLCLFKEIQSSLECCPSEDQLSIMTTANSRIEELEAQLPCIEDWCSGPRKVSERSQKEFAEQIMDLCQEGDLPQMLKRVSRLHIEFNQRLPTQDISNLNQE